MTHEEVRALVLALPETAEGTSYGLPSFKTCGRFLTRIRAEDDSLVVPVASVDEREMLIEAEPETFHITDHYRDYPTVLARIATVDPAWLRAKLLARWRRLTPRRVQKAFDEGAG